MECTTCVPPSGRRDKPHTFFAHELTTCGGCGAALEGRVVLRDGGVVMLKHCSGCGPTEELIAADGPAWVAAFLAPRQRRRRTRPATTCSSTRRRPAPAASR